MAAAVHLIRHNTTQSCLVVRSYSSNAEYIYGVNYYCTVVCIACFGFKDALKVLYIAIDNHKQTLKFTSQTNGLVQEDLKGIA